MHIINQLIKKSIIMLQKFFITCSGSDAALLETCSASEKTKYVGIGATVFFTAVMAFIASGFALFTVFDNALIAVGFGLVWGLLIFNLDRYIVSTIRKTTGFWSEFAQATPRIVLAIIIAIVISKPLEIKIFEKEISTVLLSEKNAMALANKAEVSNYFKKDLDKLQAEIDSLKVENIRKQKEVETYYQTYIAEAEGTAGTKKLGKGPVFKEKIAKHNLAKQELDTLLANNLTRIKQKEAKTKIIEADLEQKIALGKPVIDGFDGLMARINALGQLPQLPSLFIMLLFLAIETSPIIAKLLSPKGEYDFKLEDAEAALKSNLDQDKHQRKLLLATNANMHDQVYEDISQDKKLYEQQRKNATELLELQSNSFLNKQKASL